MYRKACLASIGVALGSSVGSVACCTERVVWRDLEDFEEDLRVMPFVIRVIRHRLRQSRPADQRLAQLRCLSSPSP